jgi:transcription termination/antitermination protein NusG
MDDQLTDDMPAEAGDAEAVEHGEAEAHVEAVAEEVIASDLGEPDLVIDATDAGLEADGEYEDDEFEEVLESPYDRPGKWYVLHTQSGYEKKVKSNLEARINSMNMENLIHEIVIPMEDVPEIKNGKKVVVQKKVFPGYLLVRCNLSDDSWYVIRNTPGTTGFVGQGRGSSQKPTPLSRREVETFLAPKGGMTAQAPRRSKPKVEFEINEVVRVKEGPFADFQGQIAEINVDQAKLKVLVNIFGRETLVEMDFTQVAKA